MTYFGRPYFQLQNINRTRVGSRIDPAYPVHGIPTTQSVRNNFIHARDEVEELQRNKIDYDGGTMIGPLELYSDPLSPLQAATKRYVDFAVEGITGEGGFAVSDGVSIIGNGTFSDPLRVGRVDSGRYIPPISAIMERK